MLIEFATAQRDAPSLGSSATPLMHLRSGYRYSFVQYIATWNSIIEVDEWGDYLHSLFFYITPLSYKYHKRLGKYQ